MIKVSASIFHKYKDLHTKAEKAQRLLNTEIRWFTRMYPQSYIEQIGKNIELLTKVIDLSTIKDFLDRYDASRDSYNSDSYWKIQDGFREIADIFDEVVSLLHDAYMWEKDVLLGELNRKLEEEHEGIDG